MEWTKRGRIYVPPGAPPWRSSHAQLPTVDRIDGDRWRIYFAVRDEHGRTRPTFIETPVGDPGRILREHDAAVLDLGAPGAFDDSGVMPSWVTNVEGRRYLFYTGWNVRATVPYHTEIGLAVSDDGGETYARASEGPIIGRNHIEPHLTGSPCVLHDEGIFRCWYHSGTDWTDVDGRWEPRYRIVYAESADGLSWRRDGRAVVDYGSEDEAGIGRPTVYRDGDGYRMWFAYRKGTDYRTDPDQSYRIGYAESGDGLDWDRMDDRAGIDVSPEGWDSEMISYPHVVADEETMFLLYNGNGFGRSGFGYAVA